MGLVEQSVSIYDLSEGGCFVNSPVEMTPSRRFDLKVDLPNAGWIVVTAEPVYARSGGFAVRFIALSDETRARLENSLRQLRQRSA